MKVLYKLKEKETDTLIPFLPEEFEKFAVNLINSQKESPKEFEIFFTII